MNNEILTTAVQEIDKLHNVECSITGNEFSQNGRLIDAHIRLKIGNQDILLNAEVKTKIVPAQIPMIIELKEKMAPLIVIAHYITPTAKEILIKEQIAYADTAGNLFLNTGSIYIFVDTKKPHLQYIESKSRAFTMAGLKVIFQFLLNPEYLNQPYRLIGENAMVSIRTVGKTLEGLMHEKFIIKENDKNYLFVDREKLFHRWVTEYTRHLKPKLNKRRFKWRNKDAKWFNKQLPPQTFWSGPAAGELMTNYLIADKWTIYTGQDFIAVVEKLQLVPDKNGEVEVIQKFWNNQNTAVNLESFGVNNLQIVHPILAYADLIEDVNERYTETAKIIYKEHVKNEL